MLMQWVVLLGALAIPAVLLAVADDWFFRPKRRIAAAPQPAADPPLMKALYYVLPVLVGAGVVRLLVAERLDFSLVLVLITVVTGVVWLLDAAVFRQSRVAAARAAGKDSAAIAEPGTVDYARSFFPVAVIVLVLRSFLFEPFRIPSDSMMPTLLDGDFIIVNKYAYGLRLPVINRKVIGIGDPQRGDVVVFRYPPDPSINYIKRLVGLPGDRVRVKDDKLIVNGSPVQTLDRGVYEDHCYKGMSLIEERLGNHTHRILSCPEPKAFLPQQVQGCNRKELPGHLCAESPYGFFPDRGDSEEIVVPEGSYLMIGDNRDNSSDGRVWGFVPESHLVGKASRIWFNWDLQRSGGPLWKRIGDRIE